MDNISMYGTALSNLETKYAEGSLSQKDYTAGLEEVYNNTMSDIDALTSLDEQMMSYYSDTVSMASEELTKYTDRMEHHVTVLDHFNNLLSIMGKETDYKSLGVVLAG
jgi:hypothetical protein